MKNKFNQWLICCFLFIAAMLVVRIKFTGSITYIFLIWNIFLAFIPYVFSLIFQSFLHKEKWKKVVLFCSWLLFFPNALYLVTDIIHLSYNSDVPVWFDAVLLFTASFVGLALAFASLINVERFLHEFYTKQKVKYMIAILLFAGAFGVYLGRFQRWNSWDIISNPFSLAQDIAGRFLNPIAHLYSWAIVSFLTILYALCWFSLKAITNIKNEIIPS